MGAGETVHFLPLKFKRTEVHSHFIFFFLEGVEVKYLLKKEISFFHGHVDACRDYLDLFFIFCSHIFENARVCEKDLLFTFMFNIHMCFPY